MADDVSAGRLHLDAYADTSGFARDAKTKIDAAVKNLRAKIKVDLDDRGLAAQARESAKKAQEAAKVRLQTEVDTRGLAAQIRRAASDASKQAAAKVKIGLQIDQAKFQRDLAAAVRAMDNRYSVSVGVDLDTTGAEARLAAFRASQRNLPLDMGVNINTGNLGQVISQFGMMPALAGGVFLLVGAVGQLAGGLFAVASSAAQAVTTIAALPGLVGALAMGVGTLLAGFSGIGGAVSALGEADKASAQQTEEAADTRVDAARRIADAQQALKNAYHQAADASRQAGYAVADAEWGLARAHEAAREAQVNLNEARREAREYLDDLNDSLDRAVLTEENAANTLAKAKQALQDVMWDKSSTAQEERDAQLAVKNAQQDLADAGETRKDLSKEAKKANEEGVRGSEQVEAARDSLRDANHALMLAERQMFEAQHSAADTARNNAQSIASAQQALADAQKAATDTTKAQAAATADLLAEFNKLTPAAQRFARFLFDVVMPRFDTLRDHIQEALLPPLQRGIRMSLPLIDTLEKGLLGTADVIGDFGIRLGRLFGAEGFNKNAATIMDSNNRALRLFSRTAINLIKILTDVTKVAGPTLIEPFAKWVFQLTRGWRESAKLGRETGTMRDRFIKARETLVVLKDIVVNVWDAIRGLGRAATPAGDSMLRTFRRVTKGWADYTNSVEGQDRLGEYFAQTEPFMENFGTLLGELAQSIALMGEAGGGPLNAFLTTLTVLLRGLNAVLNTPGLGSFVGWMLTLAGVGGALALVAGQFVKLAGGIRLLAKITGLTRLFNAFRLSLLGTRIGLAALWVQQKLVAGGQKALNLALVAGQKIMKGLRVAASLMFGPWGIAIIAVGALFVLLYKKVGWFRKAVDWVADKVVDAFNWMVDGAKHLWDVLFGHSVFPDIMDGLEVFWGVVKTIFGYISDAIVVLGKVFSWLWDHAVKPALGYVQKAIGLVWNYYYKPILKAIAAGIKVMAAVFVWLWKKVVKPAWRFISKAIDLAWNYYYKPILKALWKGIKVFAAVVTWLWKKVVNPAWKGIRAAIGVAWNLIKGYFSLLRKGLSVIGDAMKWLWEKAVKPAWERIQRGIDRVWGFLRDKVFDPLIDLVKNDIPDAFRKAKDGIATVWDKLRDIAAKPVKFVVDTVYNEGIRKVVNAIPGVPDLPELSFNYAKGTSSVLPGYTPGRDPHNFVSRDGRMALNLSGGEGIMRPEWVRAIGKRGVDAMNAAAARGGSALRSLLGQGPVDHSRAAGGLVPAGVKRSLSMWLGGVLPLPGATSIAQHTSGYNMPWAGDLNWPGYSDYGKPIVAWKSGVAHPFDYGRDESYGRGQIISGAGGSQLYAHMSKVITSLAGKAVRAGQTIGYVGDYGNTGEPPTSHLHFEIRDGAVDLGDASTGGAAQARGEEKKSSWMNAIGAVKDVVTKIPSKLADLAKMDGWGPLMRKAVGSFGGDLIDWVNDKVPDSISIPGPNIPLPDNPIPNPFKLDRGGQWATDTMGVNLSGQTETVFTNENIVDLTANLARIASGLRTQTVDGAGGGGKGAGIHIDKLELSAPPDKVQQVLGDLHHSLRLLSLGGVHAKRTAGAPV